MFIFCWSFPLLELKDVYWFDVHKKSKAIETGVCRLLNLSCAATKCLDARQGVCSIDSKHFYMVWRRMVGPLWQLCSKYIVFLSDNLVKKIPKQRSVLFFSVNLGIVLISCFFLLSMLGDFSACMNSVQMLW